MRHEFQLRKSYVSGRVSYARPITKPVLGTVQTGIQGETRAEALDFSVDLTTGIVRFKDAPAMGARVTAGFEFDVPVRFDTDRIAVSVASFQAGDLPQVPIVEVRI